MAPGIGVLALQGDFEAHARALAREGVCVEEIRYASQLHGLAGLVLPGGESTTHLKLLAERGLLEALKAFHGEGGALFGTCAGAILIAAAVTGPVQASLGFIDIDVERNGFGRQKESFEIEASVPAIGARPFEMVFIRAPRIRRVGPGVEVLASWNGEPVLVRQNRVLAGTFHPELSVDGRLHKYFAEMAGVVALTPS